MPAPFQTFGPTHLATLLVGAILITALIAAARFSPRTETSTRALLAFLCLASFGYSQAAWLSLGEPVDLDSSLPLQLCDVAAIVAGFALITRKPLLCSLTYFWGLAATLQALATPAIRVDFPQAPYLAFFVHHFAIVAAALYLPLVLGWRPSPTPPRAAFHAWLWCLGYAACAGIANAILHTNFGFIARKPDNPSLLDHFGPWPFYLIPVILLALLLFQLLALPFLRHRRI